MAVAEWSTDLFSINDVRLPENKEPRREWLHVKSFYFGNLVSTTLKLSEIQTPQDKSPFFFPLPHSTGAQKIQKYSKNNDLFQG